MFQWGDNSDQMKQESRNLLVGRSLTKFALIALLIGGVVFTLGDRQAVAQTWNLANDFSTTNTTSINMGISNAWSVGYDSVGVLDNNIDRVYWTTTSSPAAFNFTPFSAKDVDANGWIDHAPTRPAPYNPAWVVTDDGVPGFAKVVYTNDLDTPIGSVFLHAVDGATGGRKPIVVRWVAPSDMSNVTVTMSAWVAADYSSSENRIHVGILQVNQSTNFFRSAPESSFEFTDLNNTGDGVFLSASTNQYVQTVTNINLLAGDTLYYLIARRDDSGIAGFIGLNMTVQVPQVTSEVPEPSSLLFASLGCLALLWLRRIRTN